MDPQEQNKTPEKRSARIAALSKKRTATEMIGGASPLKQGRLSHSRSDPHLRNTVLSGERAKQSCSLEQWKVDLAELYFHQTLAQQQKVLFADFVSWFTEPSNALIAVWQMSHDDCVESYRQRRAVEEESSLSKSAASPSAADQTDRKPGDGAKHSATDDSQIMSPERKPIKVEHDTPETQLKVPKGYPVDSYGDGGTLAMRAKQEAWVMNRITELRREGLWSQKRLPRCADPPRNKTHWDYLLEEMRWMAQDFDQEHRWKKTAAKKFASLASKQKRDELEREKRVEVEHERNLRRLAAKIAKDVRSFWNGIGRVVEHKTRRLVQAKQKRALDQHLSFLVDQTEKYSTMVQEGLNVKLLSETPSTSKAASVISKEDATAGDDAEFEASEETSDDEETIEKEESGQQAEEVKEEVTALQRECGMELDDVLAQLPPGYLESRDRPLTPTSESRAEDEAEDEIEPAAAAVSVPPTTTSMLRDENIDFGKLQSDDTQERQEELSHIAEAVEKFQPKGNTLASTTVVTKVPFLLKHKLREYQHVGLDWLVTLYDKKLNGILADEMGLGKTIQTIALLAHLACEKQVWGPHLVVVPTSVMLNWEMELKKWCPAFKILTYYGSFKERAEKRKGWSKPNAFHVCITSYKLVVQDHRAFRSKKWQYLILDEAQHIKNFKSQRWQMMLNFNSERRLLLTGTPLQNNLLELWSLMHFLMPNIFASHRDFKDWFANPLTGMIEGSQEYNEGIIQRLHKVLRPFLLRRLKSEVEKQLPKKYEHIELCQLSKRQRFLYDDFMSKAETKSKLQSGSALSVLNVLMQLRKVCNHPNLFESRPVVSAFVTHGLTYQTASLACDVTESTDKPSVLREGISDLEEQSKSATDSCSNLTPYPQQIEELEHSTEPLKDPPVGGFKFKSKPQSTIHAYANEPKGGASGSNLQFIVPYTVVQQLDMRQPLMIQVQTPRGLQMVPVKFNIPQSFPLPEDEASAIPAGHTPVLRLMPSLTPNQLPTVQFVDNVVLNSANDSLASVVTPVGLASSSASHGYQPKSNTMIPVKTVLHKTISGGTGAAMAVNGPSTVQQEPVKSETPEKSGLGPSVKFVDIPSPKRSAQSRKRSITADPLDVESDAVKERKSEFKKHNLESMIGESIRRGSQQPIYGKNLVERLKIHSESSLHQVSTTERAEKLADTVKRFSLFVPPVKTFETSQLHVSHRNPGTVSEERFREALIEQNASSLFAPLHTSVTTQSLQFPELRLIEYDCGKLQKMAMLLRKLHDEGHRCLIFTQMSKMLDILEAFLCYHGYKYLRLDGATKIEHRQILMERFNQDDKIFIFILSTRSGGLGVNLTGADTVIFYDSDWNPTMDAQAQDRCHRIGQTRDVHIYRLISEKTVEENILKKAAQKRLLGEIAIEEGGFTAEFFKKSSVRELFDLNEDLGQKLDISEAELEQAMAQNEERDDARDVQAMRCAEEEARQELAEFDETRPIVDDEREEDMIDVEMRQLTEQLRPIEQYAFRMMERIMEPEVEKELRQTEEEILQRKMEWEESHRQAENFPEKQEIDDSADEGLSLFYDPEDALSQMFCPFDPLEVMETWMPPTPPPSDEDFDLYMDEMVAYDYELTPMSAAELPPVYYGLEMPMARVATKTPTKGSMLPPTTIPEQTNLKIPSPIKIPRHAVPSASAAGNMDLLQQPAPKSLFDTFPRVKRDYRRMLMESGAREDSYDPGDWAVHEDQVMLQVLHKMQKLQANGISSNLGHIPNYNLMTEMVNHFSLSFRTEAQVRFHHDQHVIPREEGRLPPTDPLAKKLKKANLTAAEMSLCKKTRQRTQQIFQQDGPTVISHSILQHFTEVRRACGKRQPTVQQQIALLNPPSAYASVNHGVSEKHAAYIASNSINYESMQNPSRLAELRETKVKERELAMKQKQAAVAAATAAAAAASTMPPYDPRQAAIHAQQQQQQYMGGGARMPGGVPPYPGRPMLPSAANVVTIPSMQPQTAVGQRFPTPQQQIGAPPQGHIMGAVRSGPFQQGQMSSGPMQPQQQFYQTRPMQPSYQQVQMRPRMPDAAAAALSSHQYTSTQYSSVQTPASVRQASPGRLLGQRKIHVTPGQSMSGGSLLVSADVMRPAVIVPQSSAQVQQQYTPVQQQTSTRVLTPVGLQQQTGQRTQFQVQMGAYPSLQQQPRRNQTGPLPRFTFSSQSSQPRQSPTPVGYSNNMPPTSGAIQSQQQGAPPQVMIYHQQQPRLAAVVNSSQSGQNYPPTSGGQQLR